MDNKRFLQLLNFLRTKQSYQAKPQKTTLKTIVSKKKKKGVSKDAVSELYNL